MRWGALAAVVVLLLAVAGLRAAALSDKHGLFHDEAIALLAATCHQGEFQRTVERGLAPLGTWVPAAAWKRFVRPEDRLCFARIAADLGREDIHPPLFFWLLHGWLLAVGSGTLAAPALNIALGVLVGLALFGLARRVFADERPAALVTAVWALSPAAVLVFADGRQYELLALVAVLFVWQVLRFCDPATCRPGRDGVLLAAVTAAGALTHFQFALVAAGGAGLLILHLRRRPRLLAGGLGALAAGYATFAVLHPGFLSSVERADAQSPSFDRAFVGLRVERVADAFSAFVLPPALSRGALSYLAAAAVIAAGAWLLIRRPDRVAERSIAFLFAWLAAAPVALYLSFRTPLPAVDAKHLSFVWPFCAFVPVLLLRGRRWQAPAAGLLLVALAAGATVAAVGAYRDHPLPAAIARADRIVIDSAARGIVLPAVWPLPDRNRVFAAPDRHLLRHRAAWERPLEAGDVVLFGLPVGDPRLASRRALARRLGAVARRRFELAPTLLVPLVPTRPYRVVRRR